MEPQKTFELGVYTFGNTPRTADGGYGPTAQAIRDALEAVHVAEAVGLDFSIRFHKPIYADDFAFLKSVTRQTPKITIPSPSMAHFRGGREAVDKQAYPEIPQFFDDLAKVYREEIADLAGRGCR